MTSTLNDAATSSVSGYKFTVTLHQSSCKNTGITLTEPTFSNEVSPHVVVEDYNSDSSVTFSDETDSSGSLTFCGTRTYSLVSDVSDTLIDWVELIYTGSGYIIEASP